MPIDGDISPLRYTSVANPAPDPNDQTGHGTNADALVHRRGTLMTCIKTGRMWITDAVTGWTQMIPSFRNTGNTVYVELKGEVDGSSNPTGNAKFQASGGGYLDVMGQLKVDASNVTLPNITSAPALGTDSSGNIIVGSGGGGGFAAVRQAYTTTTTGITIPSGASMLTILCWGGGGGGGGGALNNAGTSRCGGGGGGGGSVNIQNYLVSTLSGTLIATIGAGGTGGLGATSVAATPGPGGTGGITSVTGIWNGTSMRIGWGYLAQGGNRSATGTSAAGGGAGTQGYAGGIGGSGQANTTGSLGGQTSSSTGLSRASHGGGGGGGVNTSNSVFPGGASFGSYPPQDPNVLGGATAGADGDDEAAGRGSDWDFSRAGGGGGAGNDAGSGGDGGNGGFGAGGGGGGGGTWLGVTERGGNGGDGGSGLVVLYWT